MSKQANYLNGLLQLGTWLTEVEKDEILTQNGLASKYLVIASYSQPDILYCMCRAHPGANSRDMLTRYDVQY